MSKQSAANERAILLVDHGSRRAEATPHLDAMAELVAARRVDWIVRTAHMEFGEPGVGRGIETCVEAGATLVIVHPFFLNTGLHIQETLPAMMEQARATHPGVTIRLTEHLGLHDGLVDVVVERVEAVLGTIDDDESRR